MLREIVAFAWPQRLGERRRCLAGRWAPRIQNPASRVLRGAAALRHPALLLFLAPLPGFERSRHSQHCRETGRPCSSRPNARQGCEERVANSLQRKLLGIAWYAAGHRHDHQFGLSLDARVGVPEQVLETEHVLEAKGAADLLHHEMALAELRTFLAENFWDEDADALAHLISSGGPPDRTVTRDAELYEVGKGNQPLETWLGTYGHRAADELELAGPRWREPSQAVAVRELAACLAAADSPLECHRRHVDEVDRCMAALCGRLSGRDRREFARRVDLVRRYIAFREDGKDFLILGYDLLRDAALEAGRRLGAGQDVFFLTREELFDALRVGFAPWHLIEQQCAAFAAESRLDLPRVLDAKALDTLGDAPERAPAAGGHKAFAVLVGRGRRVARVLVSPRDAGDLGRRYVLVCPSTDPAWTPLFGNAAGLVLERGGMLSHGAVVARELGLPAVVLPGATRLFHDGEEIHVERLPRLGGETVGSGPSRFAGRDGRSERRRCRLRAGPAAAGAQGARGGEASQRAGGRLDGLPAGGLSLAGALGLAAGAGGLGHRALAARPRPGQAGDRGDRGRRHGRAFARRSAVCDRQSPAAGGQASGGGA